MKLIECRTGVTKEEEDSDAQEVVRRNKKCNGDDVKSKAKDLTEETFFASLW